LNLIVLLVRPRNYAEALRDKTTINETTIKMRSLVFRPKLPIMLIAQLIFV
jgi:hypothetical protein